MDVAGHDSHNTNRLVITHARPGFVDTEFAIARENLNRANSLHGGLISTLIDSVGSLAVASNGWYNTGISTDIHATFVKPGGGDGDTVRVTGEIISMGKTLAFTRVELRHPVTGKILGTCTRRPNAAYGSHTKFIRMAHGSPANIVFNETGEKVLEGSVPEP